MLEFLGGKTGRLAAQAAVLTAVVGGTVAYADGGKTVTLVVDGVATQLNTEGETVRALLADESIEVTDRDIVAPGLDATLEDGQQVVVRYARPVTITLDGSKRTYWTTELTVDSALSALGIRADGAKLSASRSEPLGRDGLALAVSTPKKVTLTADGATRSVSTTAASVSELLAEQGLTLGSLDKLSAAADAPISDGQQVVVRRVRTQTVTVAEDVPAPMTKQKDATLEVGDTEVLVEGEKGARTATYQVTIVDGKVTDRQLVSADVTQEPVPGVLKVGTKPKAATADNVDYTSTTGTKADSLNWAALAKCESGGNPRAVNPAGYYGLYQFSLSTWRSVGGTGNPIDATPAEQLKRAKILYNKAGSGQWGCGRHLYD